MDSGKVSDKILDCEHSAAEVRRGKQEKTTVLNFPKNGVLKMKISKETQTNLGHTVR